MKYTKKYMVVPFEAESEEELLKRKEREHDKELSDIVATNDSNSYHKYNELFKKSIYKRKNLPEEKQNSENTFGKELLEINGLIQDILENKRINDDSYYKPVSKNTRNTKNTRKTKNATILNKKNDETVKIEKKVKKNEKNNKDQIKDSIDPNKVEQLGEVLLKQINTDQIHSINKNQIPTDTDNEGKNYKTPKNSRISIFKKSSTSQAPKKEKKEKKQDWRDLPKEELLINTSWDHLK